MKKLICPQADQKDEIWNGRSECLDIIATLSLGIDTKYSEDIKDHQTIQFMEAFIKNDDEIEINYEDFFNNDPIHELNNLSNFIVTVDMGLLEKADEIKIRKNNLVEKLEQLRQKLVNEGISFENQLEKEFYGGLEAAKILLTSSFNKFKSGIFPDSNELVAWEFLGRFQFWWKELKGKPEGIEGVKKFLFSEYYKMIPFNSISSQIMAKLITGRDPIQSGHSMDITHASSAIPYVDIFLTDRYMKHTIKELGIDSEFKTNVCYIGDTNLLDNFFNSL